MYSAKRKEQMVEDILAEKKHEKVEFSNTWVVDDLCAGCMRIRGSTG